MKDNKAKLYYALIVVLFLLIGVSSFFLFYFYNLRGEDLSLEDIDISKKVQMTYNVKVKDDNFYKSSVEADTFVLSMIDNINTYFNYSEAFSSKVEGEYSYYVSGKVVMDDNGDTTETEIYKSEMQKYSVDGNIINLSNQFSINTSDILSKYNEFITTNNINVNSYIKYDIHLFYSVYSNKIEKAISDKDVVSLIIPIKDITTINKSDDISEMKHEYSDLNKEDDKTYVIIMLEFIGAIIIFILLIVLIIKRLMGRETIYEYQIRKILEKHSSDIVTLDSLPDLTDYHVLFASEFIDILDASYTVHSPINFYEVSEAKSATFIVFDKNVAYVYKIDSKNI